MRATPRSLISVGAKSHAKAAKTLAATKIPAPMASNATCAGFRGGSDNRAAGGSHEGREDQELDRGVAAH